MSDFTVRSDSVNVEQIMEQIRARIREKRGVDYTEEEIRELAAVKLEKFLDPRGVRSDLLEQFRRSRSAQPEAPLPNYTFDDEILYATHRGLLRLIRRLLNPILKLFFNPQPIVQALQIQAQVNTAREERDRARKDLEHLQYELLHNLVIETTRLGIDVKNLKMRVESVAARLDFTERRARALESVVVFKPSSADQEPPPPARPVSAAPPPLASAPRGESSLPPAPAAAPGAVAEGPGQRSRRRRRRRGRRGGAPAAAIMGGQRLVAAPGPATDNAVASEAADGHDETAESVAQALAAESHPNEPAPPSAPASEPAPGPSTARTGSGPDHEQ
jgi:hypothetical protein